MTNGGFVDPSYARSQDYRRDLDEIASEGVCPFCPENFRWHPHPILAEDGDWFITAIRQNYEHARLHYLIIGRVHKETLADMTSDDVASILRLAQRIAKDTGMPGGGIAWRFGPTKYTGATVQHIHVHLLEPEIDPDTGRAIPVMFPFG